MRNKGRPSHYETQKLPFDSEDKRKGVIVLNNSTMKNNHHIILFNQYSSLLLSFLYLFVQKALPSILNISWQWQQGNNSQPSNENHKELLCGEPQLGHCSCWFLFIFRIVNAIFFLSFWCY